MKGLLTSARRLNFRSKWKILHVVISLAGALARGQSFPTYLDLHDHGGSITTASGFVLPDGSNPIAVTFDIAGNMYGVTSSGGANGFGMLWKISTSGAYTDLHDFGGTIALANGTYGADGEGPLDKVTVDSVGNIYGTAPRGGGMNGGMVWKCSSKGAYQDLHDFGATIVTSSGATGQDGASPYGPVTLDASGDLFGTTLQGGPHYAGMVWELSIGSGYKDWHDFGGQVALTTGKMGSDGTYSASGVALDSAGDLVGTTLDGGAYGYGILWKITKSGLFSDLHDFGGTITNASGLSGPDGQAPNTPSFDSAGNLYGTTSSGGAEHGMVWELTSASKYKDLHDFGPTVITANGSSGPDGIDPQGPISLDSSGNLYGATSEGGPNDPYYEGYGGTVFEITKAGLYRDLHDFGGVVTNANGSSGLDGTSPSKGVTLDSSGNLYGAAEGSGANTQLGISPGMIWELATGAQIKGVSLATTKVVGSASTTGTVTLSTPAPTGGRTVFLTSNSADATVPASVSVAAGSSTGTFTVKTPPVGGSVGTAIVARVGYFSMAAPLTVLPASLSSVTLSAVSVKGSGSTSVTGTITLTGSPTSTGATVALSSSNPCLTVPASVAVHSGNTTATFSVQHSKVTVNTPVTVTATYGTVSQSFAITVTP